KELILFDELIYDFCNNKGKLNKYKFANFIITRNFLFRLDYDFNKLSKEMKEKVLIASTELMKRTIKYNKNSFNKLNLLIISFVVDGKFKQLVHFLGLKISKQYYEERMQAIEGRDKRLSEVKKSKSWMLT